jgi:hypothetical protein
MVSFKVEASSLPIANFKSVGLMVNWKLAIQADSGGRIKVILWVIVKGTFI